MTRTTNILGDVGWCGCLMVKAEWEPPVEEVGAGVRYDVLEGPLGSLHHFADTRCEGRAIESTATLVAGAGSRWWLVRARGAGAPATYGSPSADGPSACD